MSGEKRKVTVLDAGVLLALALGEPAAKGLGAEIGKGEKLFACTELGLCELLYVLCRRIGWRKAKRKLHLLIKSSTVRFIPTSALWLESARIKCKVPIALPDCLIIAAARVTRGIALFARREKEIANAVERGQLKENIAFLDL